MKYAELRYWAQVITKDLGLDTLPELDLRDSIYGSHFDAISQKLWISPRELSQTGHCPAVVLAHELRHYWQYKQGLIQLSPDRAHMFWKGSLITPFALFFIPHNQKEWELDAMKYENEFARKHGLKQVRTDDGRYLDNAA